MTPHDEKQLQKLLTSLNHRLSPTVFLVIGNTEALRQRLQQRVEAESPKYKHITIDMEPHAVYSLRDAIARFVPDEVKTSKPLEYVVHFTGLSASLWETKDGLLRHTRLLEELNFERERLFHDYPFISFIWETPYFYKGIFYKAGDLMSWLVDRYEFVENDVQERIVVIPDKKPLDHRGADSRRLHQIERLKHLLERLDEEGGDTKQHIAEKTDTLLTLGVEYSKAFEWEEAHRCLLKAQRLVEQHYAGTYREAQMYFYLGDLALAVHDLPEALTRYEAALAAEQIHQPNSDNIGRIHHQIGVVYQEQRLWDKALNNYRKALNLKEQTGDRFEMGSTLHQIGMVYLGQRRWDEALDSYQKALEMHEQTGNWIKMGGTQHQIGMVYQELRRWDEALNSYQKALNIKEQTGNQFEMSSTLHQIGRVYEKQHRWNEALVSYQKALTLKGQTGNRFEMGITHHQIGMVYQKQNRWDEALDSYRKALELKKQTGNRFEIGITYHQIGRVYEEQHRLAEALNSYQKALELKEQTGNRFQMGSTYHQIGRIYEAQLMYRQALDFFQKAVENLREFQDPQLPTAEASLARVEAKMNEHP